MSVTIADHPEAQRYEMTAEGQRLGFITYRLTDNVISLLHTEVDPAHERKGRGSRLVEGTLGAARQRGLKVRPVCSFVATFMERHPEYQDLLA